MPHEELYNERELLLQIAKGNEKAFAVVVGHYRKNVYTSALHLVHTKVLAEEVLQDVFLKVWLQRDKLPEINNFPAWLNTISRNTMYTAFKRSLKEGSINIETEEWQLVSTENTEDRLVNKEYDQLLKEAVDKLPPKQKRTWQLIREEGLKREEAAALLNISPETVKFNLEEAARKVRAYCLSRLPLTVVLLLMHIK